MAKACMNRYSHCTGTLNVSMDTARPGAVFKELTGSRKGTITVGAGGWADFPVYGKAVAVWVQE